VVERIRALLEAPLDPAVSRSTVVLAMAAGIGFAIFALLGGVGGRPTGRIKATQSAGAPRLSITRSTAPASPAASVADQDPEDRPGTVAHVREAREVSRHRGLQHVPYSAGGVSIELVGAWRGRAVLRVEAPTVAAARRGWREFLRRYDDAGTAYIPRLGEAGVRRGR
jgi:hypothetical protein